MKKNLLTVLNYFGYFSYAPSFDEIHTFFPQKITKKSLRSFLTANIQAQKLKSITLVSNAQSFSLLYGSIKHYPLTPHCTRYTLPQYSMKNKRILDKKLAIPDKKLVAAIHKYIWIMRRLPFVRFVGITGKSAMGGVRINDDLDLCIVTKRNQLWLSRFCVIIIAKVLGIHGNMGVCLNLFFDEANLIIPKQKQNSYIAHELLQMKPIVDKDEKYRQFLNDNKWIYRYFPNANKAKMKLLPYVHSQQRKIDIFIDSFFKLIQLPLILRNRTAFHITSTQLWLFKSDFEKKLKRAGLVI